MSERTCSNCKFWNTDEPQYDRLPDVGHCTYAVMKWDATEWNAEGDARVLKAEFSDQKAFVQDGSDYMAALYTRGDFGCVCFAALSEEREA